MDMEENGVSIYGQNQPAMNYVMQSLMDNINKLRTGMKEETGSDPVEHCLARIKSEDSMREKCERRNLPVTTQSALEVLTDAIGLRVVCAFIKDVYLVRDYLDQLLGCDIVEEKDYIKHAKPNGYRSLHLILKVTVDPKEMEENGIEEFLPSYFAEIQLRTISMDTWAALEHNMRYKHTIQGNQKLIESELKRCADELAATDMSMQTIRDMINEEVSE